MTMLENALTMLAALGVLVLLVTVGTGGGWRLAWRLTAFGLVVLSAELTVIQLAPGIGGWVLGVVK
ncbi:hypothetical protein ACFY64_31665 [Streptomyces collinus]|uniref:hypothetical protein n=1 Tax=Streptomyces collinus TaxID=42684 RepID=UPI0036A370CF